MTRGVAPLQVGIVGLGHVGAVHIEAIRRTPGLELRACCDQNEHLDRVVPATVPFYSDMVRMLDDADLDVVVIATPNATHERLAMRCASADVDVILEKPSAASVDGFDVVTSLYERRGLLLYHALHAEHGLEMELFSEFAQDLAASLGPLTGFSCVFHDPYVDASGIRKHAQSLGDSWVDSGINALSVLAKVVDLQRLELVNRTSGRLPTGRTSVQSTAHFRIFADARNQELTRPAPVAGMGTINTSWIDGEDNKRTWLHFGRSGTEVLLDHSDQSMVIREPGQLVRRLTAKMSDHPRLLNHYLGVFGEYTECRHNGRSNGIVARRILELLYGGLA